MNLARLNAELLDRLPGLFTADELGDEPWPTVDALRGRVMTVLSGSLRTRLGYVRDPGHNPAVAVNAAGHVVEVHDSGGGDLWYWTGEHVTPNRVRWHRHGHYDTGQKPAIALDDWREARARGPLERADGEALVLEREVESVG